MELDIYQYTDYRRFLKDFYTAKKQANPAYSYRAFSKAAQLSSENYLWQVINGKLNLSSTTIRKFLGGLKLRKHEAAFFENLVFFNQAKTPEEKNHYYQRMSSSKRYIKARHLEKDQFEYLSKWYYAAVRELVLLPDFQLDPVWIAKRLSPSINLKDAQEAIGLLLRLELIGKDETGRTIQTERHLTSGYEVQSLAAVNYHQQMISRASEALKRTKSEHRDISALTVAVSRKKISEVKRRIHEFKRELHEFMADGEGADVVYQLNLQLFNLSEVPDEAC